MFQGRVADLDLPSFLAEEGAESRPLRFADAKRRDRRGLRIPARGHAADFIYNPDVHLEGWPSPV
jgi:hypothetical protein